MLMLFGVKIYSIREKRSSINLKKGKVCKIEFKLEVRKS